MSPPGAGTRSCGTWGASVSSIGAVVPASAAVIAVAARLAVAVVFGSAAAGGTATPVTTTVPPAATATWDAAAEPTTVLRGRSATLPGVRPGTALSFPADRGAHPAFGTEWWYVTGWLEAPGNAPIGFQITFFRVRNVAAEANPSRFAPRQVLLAHVAVSSRASGGLLVHQRTARTGFGVAEARSGATDVWIDDWHLNESADGYAAHIATPDYALALDLRRTVEPLLNGDGGWARKGAEARSASYYYSEPQLAASGRLVLHGREHPVRGRAWLDHEWMSEDLEPGLVGWDWLGINFDDGGAVMAYRMRARDGSIRWAAATRRLPDGTVRRYAPDAIEFTAGRSWHSPRTGASYPVEWSVRIDGEHLHLRPLADDQEVDGRRSVGAAYWEGAVSADTDHGAPGREYLELTGYQAPLKLRGPLR